MDAGHKDIILNTMEEGVVVPALHHARREGGPCLRRSHGAGDAALPRGGCLRPAGDGPTPPARQTMEVYMAADLSAERNQAVELPLEEADILPPLAEAGQRS